MYLFFRFLAISPLSNNIFLTFSRPLSGRSCYAWVIYLLPLFMSMVMVVAGCCSHLLLSMLLQSMHTNLYFLHTTRNMHRIIWHMEGFPLRLLCLHLLYIICPTCFPRNQGVGVELFSFHWLLYMKLSMVSFPPIGTKSFRFYHLMCWYFQYLLPTYISFS